VSNCDITEADEVVETLPGDEHGENQRTRINGRLVGFHVTRKRNVKKIMKEGIVPHEPEDTMEQEDKAVFLFKTREGTYNALVNWLGERLDEWEEEHDEKYNEVVLIIDIDRLGCIDSANYEWECLETIPASRILKVIEHFSFNT
jgi:hypothetical protein